jgi:hypothetical protein
MSSLIRYSSFDQLKKNSESKLSVKKKSSKYKAEAESFLKLLSSINKNVIRK